MRESISGKARFGLRVPGFVLNAKLETRNSKLLSYAKLTFSWRVVLLIAVIVFDKGRVSAQSLQKSIAMIGARSGSSLPLWIAKDARLYAKYGLDVELVYAVHPAPIAAVITGQAAMTSSGSDPALLAAAKDPSLVVLGGFMNKGSFAMIGSKSATDMKQQNGRAS